MRLKDFIAAMYDAGWRDNCDAQHSGIKALHKQLFSVIAEMEEEMEDARLEAKEFMERCE
jgi:hypothetical protein